jgi:hypothetical protein
MGDADRTGYWQPALLHNGKPVSNGPGESRITAYYTAQAKPPIKPFPFGLRMIAGDSKATTSQRGILSFRCKGLSGGETAQITTMPSCAPGFYISAKVRFPNCWNQRSLDSADHKSHVAYSDGNGNCPASHPYPMPTVTQTMHWLKAVGLPARSLSFSSGGHFSLHADFMNAWSPAVLKWLVDNCMNKNRNCNGISRNQIPVANGTFA